MFHAPTVWVKLEKLIPWAGFATNYSKSLIRYNKRSNVERVNGRLKDEFGGKMVRVRGYAKVMTHLMFGIIALTSDQLMRFVT